MVLYGKTPGDQARRFLNVSFRRMPVHCRPEVLEFGVGNPKLSGPRQDRIFYGAHCGRIGRSTAAGLQRDA
jgi:hypothetical protein